MAISRKEFAQCIRALNDQDAETRKAAIRAFGPEDEGILPELLGEIERRSNFDDPLWKKMCYIFLVGAMRYNRIDGQRNRKDYNWRLRQAAMIVFRKYPHFIATQRKRIKRFCQDLNGRVVEATLKTLDNAGLSDESIELADA